MILDRFYPISAQRCVVTTRCAGSSPGRSPRLPRRALCIVLLPCDIAHEPPRVTETGHALPSRRAGFRRDGPAEEKQVATAGMEEDVDRRAGGSTRAGDSGGMPGHDPQAYLDERGPASAAEVSPADVRSPTRQQFAQCADRRASLRRKQGAEQPALEAHLPIRRAVRQELEGAPAHRSTIAWSTGAHVTRPALPGRRSGMVRVDGRRRRGRRPLRRRGAPYRLSSARRRNTAPTVSRISRAPCRAVSWPGPSYIGATSTRSMPITLQRAQTARRIALAS